MESSSTGGGFAAMRSVMMSRSFSSRVSVSYQSISNVFESIDFIFIVSRREYQKFGFLGEFVFWLGYCPLTTVSFMIHWSGEV